jgi:hypothetical protein
MVLLLCYAVIRMIEAMSADWNFRTKFAPFLLLMISPGIFCGLIYLVIREIRAFRLFLECMVASILLGFLLPRSEVFRILWLLPACFGLGALLALLATRFGKRRRKRWTVLPDLPAPVRKRGIEYGEPPPPKSAMPREEARKRLAEKVAARSPGLKAAIEAPRLRPGAEAVRFLLVAGIYTILHYICQGLSAISSIYTDLPQPAFFFLYPPMLCGLLLWLLGEIGPGRVLVYLVATVLIAGLIDPAMVDRPVALFVIFFIFGMGFIITLATRIGQERRKALLRVRRLEDPAIVERSAGEGIPPGTEEDDAGEEDDREKRRSMKRRLDRKFKSQREHTRWYRHLWWSR